MEGLSLLPHKGGGRMKYLILLASLICLSCAPPPVQREGKVLTFYTVDRGITKTYHLVVVRGDGYRLPRYWDSVYLEPEEYRHLLIILQEGGR